eukprot:CAMPEP_0201519188 /NCGR_PEP_ID=MMETSP0161_2-20130828/9807_1 /ASSEMBLY_ACC=CAM_ASM_000251 /TAXON_ID=180227 /ORGANISM="Neoparamoeba aestuarina, Strain SoJaBio B1-5/56/2" /LENGTH=202 /DNA_ID=CAMNT_0047917145 /DNA_START=146 /DNA_END=754 /DNA_ORIENTATION=+
MYVSHDDAIYEDDIYELAIDKEADEPTKDKERDWFGCLIMVPIRLGLEKVHPDYKCSIQKFFQFPQCLGIIGGKKNQSMWFVACQDESVFYFDPHVVQESVHDLQDDIVQTYHSRKPRKIKIDEMDPSMTVGFLCQTHDSFEDLKERLYKMKEMGSPIVSMCKGNSPYVPEGAQEQQEKGLAALKDFENYFSKYHSRLKKKT